MNILLTNDDGYDSMYLAGLADSLKFLGHEVTIVAPLRNKSAVSHSITLHKPISVTPKDAGIFAVDGTPVDCVYIALNAIMDKKPDLIISGINDGPNFGEDIIYSGTVAAAREAFMKGYKSISISKVYGNKLDMSKMFHLSTSILLKLAMYPLNSYFFNVNIPDTEDLTDYHEFTELSARKWEEEVSLLTQQDEKTYYTIGGFEGNSRIKKGSDADILKKGIISVTPLTDGYTDFNFFNNIKKKL